MKIKSIFLGIVLVFFAVAQNNAYASCANFDTAQSTIGGVSTSTYEKVYNLTATTQINPGGNMHCASTSAKYIYDTTNKKWGYVEQCASCASGYDRFDETTVYIGSCSWTYHYCVKCATTATGTTLGSPTNPGNCSSLSGLNYLYSSHANGHFQYRSCNTCNTGFRREQETIENGICTAIRYVCVRCEPGQFYDPQNVSVSPHCSACPDGTYSDTYDATSCTSCPAAINTAYTNSNLSTVATYSNDKIDQDDKSTVNGCYLLAGSYYNSKGRFTTSSCYYNGTVRESTFDCTIATSMCTTVAGTSGTIYTAGAPYGAHNQGQACWCGYGDGTYNGAAKWIFIGTMGPSASGDTGNCAGTCTAAFCANQVANNTTLRTNLGCD